MRFPIHVRPADCDAYGHVNNAVYLSYVEYAFAAWLRGLGVNIEACWRLEGREAWHPVEIAAVYTHPTYLGQTLETEIWALPAAQAREMEQVVVGAQVRDPAGEDAFRCRLTWRRVDRQTGEPLPLPPELHAALPDHQPPAGMKIPHLQALPPYQGDVPAFRSTHTVRRSEIAAGDWVHPAALLHWVEEAIYIAGRSVDWPAERILSHRTVILQHRHDLHITMLPRREEEIDIYSRVVAMRRVRGVWQHDLVRRADGQLLARNWSTGVFMTFDGRPTRPPAGMLTAFRWTGAEED